MDTEAKLRHQYPLRILRQRTDVDNYLTRPSYVRF